MTNRKPFTRLSATYPGKRLTRIVSKTRHSLLRFKELIVLSVLVYGDKTGRGLSRYRLSLLTGIHYSQTLPGILDQLAGYGLASQVGNRWQALEPTGEIVGWFGWRSKGETWRERLAYNWRLSPAPGSRLSALTAAVICQFSLGVRSCKRIAVWLGASAKTVQRAKKLYAVGIKPEWLQDKGPIKKKKRKTVEAPLRLGQHFKALDPKKEQDRIVIDTFNRWGDQLLAAKYTRADIMRLFSHCDGILPAEIMFEEFLFWFPTAFAEVEKIQRRRLAEGATNSPNSYGLLKSKFDAWAEKLNYSVLIEP